MVSKSNLFKRAWAMVRLNAKGACPLTFSAALRLAWREWKAGDVEFWAEAAPTPAQIVRDRIAYLETADRLGRVGLRNLAAAYAVAA